MYTYTPNAPSMVYLPTFTQHKSPRHVGKYTSTMDHMATTYIYIHMERWQCLRTSPSVACCGLGGGTMIFPTVSGKS